jgi:hypothetical protein
MFSAPACRGFVPESARCRAAPSGCFGLSAALMARAATLAGRGSIELRRARGARPVQATYTISPSAAIPISCSIPHTPQTLLTCHTSPNSLR